MKKRDVIQYIVVPIIGYSIGFGISNTILHATTTSTTNTSTKTIVADMYTYTCENCGYENAEGDYSYVSQQGFERCPECGIYRDITSPRD